MSQRDQESNLNEGSAVAKPKSMNLNLSSMRKVLSQEVRGPNCPENRSLDQHGVSARSWTQSAKGRGQPLRKAEARIPKYADLQFRVLGERLQEHKEKGDRCRRCTTPGDPITQAQHIDLVNVHVDNNEAAIHMGQNYTENLGIYKKYELRGASEFIRYYSEIGIIRARRDSECEHD